MLHKMYFSLQAAGCWKVSQYTAMVCNRAITISILTAIIMAKQSSHNDTVHYL